MRDAGLLYPAAGWLMPLAAGIAIHRLWGFTPFGVLALTAAAMLLVLFSSRSTASRAAVALAAFFGFFSLHFAASAFDHPHHVAHIAPAQGALAGTVTGGFEYYPDGCRFRMEAETFNGAPARGGVQISLREGDAPPLPGDSITVNPVRLKPVIGFRNIGGFDYAAYLKDEGIGARVSARADDLTVTSAASALNPFAQGERLRRALNGWITEHLPPEHSPSAAAIAIGVTGGLGRDIKRDYAVAGIAHLFSVSGLHVGFIAGGAFFLFNHLFFTLCWRYRRPWAEAGVPRRAAALAALLAVALFIFTAGVKLAAVRAGIMAAVFFISLALWRESSLLNSLSLAALLTLLVDPAALFSVSFILSYGAMLVIVLLLQHRAAREPDPLEEAAPKSRWRPWREEALFTVKVSVAITAGLAPVMMAVFNELHLAGVLANLIALPLGAAALPGFFAAAIGGAVLPFASDALAWCAALPFAALDGMAAFFGAHPLLSFAGPTPAPWLIALYYAALLLWVFRLRYRAHAAALLCGALTVFYWPAPPPHAEFRFIDVGQGDATLIRFANGGAVLVDGGPAFAAMDAGEQAVLPVLRRLNVRRLDAVIATHGDMDHVGGLFTILRRFPVSAYYDNGGQEKMLLALRETAREQGVPAAVLGAGAVLPMKGGRISVLHPTADYDERTKQNNNYSLALLVETEGKRLLLPGDAETPAERFMVARGAVPKVDVLHVAHHGSRGSTTPEFLAAAAPKLAVISAGPLNIFHFPSRVTLEKLEARGVDVLRTDALGEIVLRPAPEGFSVESWALPAARPAP